MEVGSTPGEGACFRLCLPLAAGNRGAPGDGGATQ
jgi:signal transduction histidine kinase